MSTKVLTIDTLFASQLMHTLADTATRRFNVLVRAQRASDLDPFRRRFPVQQSRPLPGLGRCTLFGEGLVAGFEKDESLVDYLHRIGFDDVDALQIQTEAMHGQSIFFVRSFLPQDQDLEADVFDSEDVGVYVADGASDVAAPNAVI